ncbi:hypothetical protein [Alkalihalobacterium bogoriense]|uniref:hypothetical protein n=1 Tax=Alkalihalobacterium bogoriense TaxID=246272 RepID=UPI00047AAF1D|nr:hypothetical protein [Alkalihalobacterium bogoriense]
MITTQLNLNIPTILVEQKQWNCFRYMEGSQEVKVQPYDRRHGLGLNIVNKNNWLSYEEATAKLSDQKLDGVGFILSEEDDYVSLVVNNCKNDTKEWSKTATFTMDKLRGKAFAVYLQQLNQLQFLCKVGQDLETSLITLSDLEIHSKSYFFAVTDETIEDFDVVSDCTAEIESIVKEFRDKRQGNEGVEGVVEEGEPSEQNCSSNDKFVDRHYFNDLEQQLKDVSQWDGSIISAFNNEAGSGKSHFSFDTFADIAVNTEHKILYVQRFKRNEALVQTVNEINKHAGEKVADFIDGDINKVTRNKRKKSKREKKLKAKVLVITHKMYSKICKGEYSDIIEGREILVIDEFFDPVERVTVTEQDIKELWYEAGRFTNQALIETLAKELRDLLELHIENPRNNKKIPFIDFPKDKYDSYKEILQEFLILKDTKAKEEIVFAEKILKILENGCRYYNKAFHTFDNHLKFKLLNNNIVLDANAGFDYRYQLSKFFHVRPQDKFFSYENSIFTHYKVNTSKLALSKNSNLFELALKVLPLDFKDKTLYVVDKESVDKLKNELHNFLKCLQKSEDEIETIMNEMIEIDYFGNLIGENNYRDFSKVVTLKTPNYDYLSYVLQYDYFKGSEEKQEDIEIFKHEGVERIRTTNILGEIYQALKRINRDNSRPAEYIVFTSNDLVVDQLIHEFPNIQVERKEIEIADETDIEIKKENKQTEMNIRRNKIKEYLLQCKEAGKSEVSKQEIKDAIDYHDAKNFSKLLNPLKVFFDQHGMINKKYAIVIEDNINEKQAS